VAGGQREASAGAGNGNTTRTCSIMNSAKGFSLNGNYLRLENVRETLDLEKSVHTSQSGSNVNTDTITQLYETAFILLQLTAIMCYYLLLHYYNHCKRESKNIFREAVNANIIYTRSFLGISNVYINEMKKFRNKIDNTSII